MVDHLGSFQTMNIKETRDTIEEYHKDIGVEASSASPKKNILLMLEWHDNYTPVKACSNTWSVTPKSIPRGLFIHACDETMLLVGQLSGVNSCVTEANDLLRVSSQFESTSQAFETHEKTWAISSLAFDLNIPSYVSTNEGLVSDHANVQYRFDKELGNINKPNDVTMLVLMRTIIMDFEYDADSSKNKEANDYDEVMIDEENEIHEAEVEVYLFGLRDNGYEMDIDDFDTDSSGKVDCPGGRRSALNKLRKAYMEVEGIGSVHTHSVALFDVYYIPNLTMNLAIVSKICDFRCDVNFVVSDCCIYDQKTKEVVRKGNRGGDIYVLDHYRDIHNTASSSVDLSSFWLNRPSLAFYLWHSRVGHESGSSSTATIDLVHYDVWGLLLYPPKEVLDIMFLLSKTSRYTWIYMMKRRYIYHTSCTNTPQQNGVAKRKHCQLVEIAISFLLSADVPSVFWKETVLQPRILFIASVHHLHEPNSYREVVCDPLWQVTIAKELAALHQTQTWDLVPFLVGKRAIGFLWVYKIKTKSDGSITRYKARLVSKGYAQEYGIYYEKTFALVTKITTVRTLIAVNSSRKRKISQSDVMNAFLNGDMNEEIFMKSLPGVLHKAREVCKLRKALYGLKQEPRAWYKKFATVVTSFRIESLKLELAHRFSMKGMSLACYFLRIKVASSPKGYLLSQSKYIDGDPLPDPIHIVSQFVSAPKTVHWTVVLHILRYLRGHNKLTCKGQGKPSNNGGVFGNQGHSSRSQAVVSQVDMVRSQAFGSQADMVGS
uniref:Gag-Pol polyprotein n=1 Tax=Tanacetum cinerariifolium TaxID=118510 RepID=A0A6L2MKW5_TANCI|nr:Gag-Pol polyprotein [Tanacetum cinerariifolium]